jgi:hypothetical protein
VVRYGEVGTGVGTGGQVCVMNGLCGTANGATLASAPTTDTQKCQAGTPTAVTGS